ncbi:MAG: hypothetical protein HY260_11125 [Chloroflexi bacterium]|nr:hypothetical protein [Chloroflexota bacterium]
MAESNPTVTLTNPTSNSNNTLSNGSFTFQGNCGFVNGVSVTLTRSGGGDNNGSATLNANTWSCTLNNITAASGYSIRVSGSPGGSAVAQNVTFSS